GLEGWSGGFRTRNCPDGTLPRVVKGAAKTRDVSASGRPGASRPPTWTGDGATLPGLHLAAPAARPTIAVPRRSPAHGFRRPPPVPAGSRPGRGPARPGDHPGRPVGVPALPGPCRGPGAAQGRAPPCRGPDADQPRGRG